MPNQFVGRSRALSRAGLASATRRLSVGLPEIWAVIAVETSGCGFLPDRRPQILYERHLFHRLTNGRFDDGDISDPEPGGYGPPGSHQYDRLARAMARDRAAALQSTSWGLGQILGKNAEMVGFDDLDAFVDAMSDSEDAQLAAVASFVRAAGLHGALRRHDWKAFARGYNGPAFAKHGYDVRLSGEYRKAAAGARPDVNVRTAQLYLLYKGFDVGPVDGILGQHTRWAVAQFRTENGLAQTGQVDDDLLERLMPA